MSFSLPLGGTADQCGICGYDIQDDDCRGLIGLNGVLCDHCSHNLGHFTPGWYGFKLPNQSEPVEIFEYTGYPDTPFYESEVSGLFIDAPGIESDPSVVHARYEQLPPTVKDLIQSLPRGELPDGFTELVPEWADDHPPVAAHAVSPPDEHPLYEVDRYLPRPYAISGHSIVALEADLPSSIDTLLASNSADDATTDDPDPAQGTLAGLSSADTGTSPTDSPSETASNSQSRTVTESDPAPDQTENSQVSLGSFG